jgi:hypothetical protein
LTVTWPNHLKASYPYSVYFHGLVIDKRPIRCQRHHPCCLPDSWKSICPTHPRCETFFIPLTISHWHFGQTAKEGTLHILHEALKAGIKKVVVTSTSGTTMNRTFSRTESTLKVVWHPRAIADVSLTFSGKTLTSKGERHPKWSSFCNAHSCSLVLES